MNNTVLYTEWTQNHSLISISYKIKNYWNSFINMRLQIYYLKKFLIFPPAARWRWNARWRSLHNNGGGACWNFIKQRVSWLCSELSNSNLMWIPLGVREGQSLCTSTTRNRGWDAGTHHCSCQLGHAGYAAKCLDRARLSHRYLPSKKRGAHWVCVIPHEIKQNYTKIQPYKQR